MGNIMHLEDNLLQIKGATKVVSTTQAQAVIEMQEECVVVSGKEIEVKKLNLEEQEVCLQGQLSQIKFEQCKGKTQPFLKRIFK